MQAFAALADPVRAHIVELLTEGELRMGEISAHFLISRQAVSRHLAILCDAELVDVRRDAHQSVYSLNPLGFARIEDWVMARRRADGRQDQAPAELASA
jgi:DNA-binding transcriptional ArsR family regulator